MPEKCEVSPRAYQGRGLTSQAEGSRDTVYKYIFPLESLHLGTVLHSELMPCWGGTGYLCTQGSSLTHSASLFPEAHYVTRNTVLTLSLAAEGQEKGQIFCRPGRTLLPPAETLNPGSFILPLQYLILSLPFLCQFCSLAEPHQVIHRP